MHIVSFEILGMLGQTLHIDNTCFTYIPNPTSDRWDERSLSLTNIMKAYKELSRVQLLEAPRNKIIHSQILRHIDNILSHQASRGTAQRLLLLQALHTALDDTDKILTAKAKVPHQMSHRKSGSSLMSQDRKCAEVVETVHASEAGQQSQRRQVVQDVLRSHLQEVLRLLNVPDDRQCDPQTLPAADTSLPSRADSVVGSALPSFRDIDKEGPEYREHKYMEVYFRVIRQNVVPLSKYSTYRRDSLHPSAAITGTHPEPLHDDVKELEKPAISPPEYDTFPKANKGADEPKYIAPGCSDTSEQLLHAGLHAKTASLVGQHVSHDDIWCTLVFRMICWLMLHDFNRQDVQVSKSELLGSRMPVYIA